MKVDAIKLAGSTLVATLLPAAAGLAAAEPGCGFP